MIIGMTKQRTAIVALATAGALWGLTVPLSKLGLEWLGAGWLAVARFAIAAPLLALVARRGLRAALTPGVALAGAVGYGGVIVLQNAGIERTSVSHAALIVGAVPVLVVIITALLRRGSSPAPAWAGALVALAGVGLVAGGGGAGTTLAGDLLVLLSVGGSAFFIVFQPGLLAGRDPAAVTAVQLGSAGLASLPVAIVLEGAPPAPSGAERRHRRAAAGAHRHGTGVLALRMGAGARPGRGGRRVREPRAADRRAHRRRGVPRRGRAAAARGRCGDPRRDHARAAAESGGLRGRRARFTCRSGSVAVRTMPAAGGRPPARPRPSPTRGARARSRARSPAPSTQSQRLSRLALVGVAVAIIVRRCASGDAPRSRPRVSRSAPARYEELTSA